MEGGRLDPIIAQFNSVEFVYVPRQGDIPDDASGEVLLTIPRGYPNLAELLDRGVEWVHLTSTGIDGFPLELMGDRVLTCSRGASAIGISEWCLAMMLAFEKDLPGVWLNSPPERWFTADLGALYRKTLGLIGLGGIGSAVARRALAFDMTVLAVRRTAAPSLLEGVEIVNSLAELYWPAPTTSWWPRQPPRPHAIFWMPTPWPQPNQGLTSSTSPAAISSTRMPCGLRSTAGTSPAHRWTRWNPSRCRRDTGYTTTPRCGSAPMFRGACLNHGVF